MVARYFRQRPRPRLARGSQPTGLLALAVSLFWRSNVGVLQQRSHETARAARIPQSAVCSNVSLERTLPHRESHRWVERVTDGAATAAALKPYSLARGAIDLPTEQPPRDSAHRAHHPGARRPCTASNQEKVNDTSLSLSRSNVEFCSSALIKLRGQRAVRHALSAATYR